MTLSEFYKERMAANPGLTRRDLVDAVGSATVYALQHDVPRNFRKSTLHKLAELWKCSVGDIQACLAELPNPLRKEAEKPEGNAGISITAGAGKSRKKVAPAPDPKDEEPAEVFQLDESNVDMMFPPEPEPTAEQLEEKTEKLTNELMDMAIKAYQLKLKDKVGKILASTHHELTDAVRQEIGVMLLQELWGDGNEN